MLAFATSLWIALIPPMDPQELEAAADLIVEGQVLSVKEHGEPWEDHCYGWQTMEATFAVTTALKGDKPPEPVRIRYPTMIKNERGCVGGRTSYTLTAKKKYRLHLAKGKQDPKGPPVYGFINWAGVRPLR